MRKVSFGKIRRGSDWFDILVYVVMFLVAAVTLYPFLNTIVVSLNDGIDTARGGLTLWPRKFTLANYQAVFADSRIPRSFCISVARTVIGAALAVVVTSLFAYPLSRPYFHGRQIYMTLALITMYFSGGLIPQYLLYLKLGLVNSFWVYILPGMLNVYQMLIVRTYFLGIPKEVEESAFVDGAKHLRIFFQIMLPLSMPVIAVIILYNAVSQWNSWFDAYIYIRNRNLLPLQSILIEIVNVNKMSELEEMASAEIGMAAQQLTTRSVTAAVMIVTCLPIICVYPFLQKYFVKGVMIGSVKG